jgi:hypothetical protein
MPKTATSALYKYIANSLQDPVTYFEPSYFGAARGKGPEFHRKATAKARRPLVTKCLFHPLYREGQPDLIREAAKCYDKVIIIDRDPRDRLISENFYQWYSGHKCWPREELVEYLALLRAKESAPASVPFFRLCKRLPWERGDDYLEKRERGTYSNLLRLRELTQDFFAIRYEDFVDGKWVDLESYLGFPIQAEGVPQSDVDRRVVRTKRYGNWRDWLTDEDVAFFEPLYAGFLDAFYPGHDWLLSYPEALDPSVGSDYVERIANM